MNGLFNMDNAFFTTIGKIVDIVIVSFLWTILLIPIVTIGPATTALYYTMVKVIRKERGYLFREFFSSFKANFKVGALSTLWVILFYIIILTDIRISRDIEGIPGFLLVAVFNSLLILITAMTIYVFPVLSRFKIKTKELLKTSLFMSMKHLPTTILLAVIILVFALAVYIFLPVVFIAPGLCMLVVSFLMERVFRKYMPEKSGESEGEYPTRDEWYLG